MFLCTRNPSELCSLAFSLGGKNQSSAQTLFFFIGLPGVSYWKSAVLGNTSPQANMEEEMTLPVYDFELLYFCAK